MVDEDQLGESGDSASQCWYYYLHGDHLGSTSLTTDDAGTVVAWQLYNPYGTVRYASGQAETDFGFTGQRLDGTGLVYMHARYYDPYLNRLVSPDTIVPGPGNPQSLNRYSYVRNRPGAYVDVDGHGLFLTALIGAAVGAVVGAVAYTVNSVASGEEWDISEFAVATGTMAGAGMLIGTGVGAAAGVAAAGTFFATTSGAAVATVITGTGVGMAAGGGGTMIANTIRGQDFDTTEFLVNTAAGGVNGAVTTAIPGYGVGPLLARAGVSATVGAGQYAANEALHGRTPRAGEALGSAALGFAVGGVADIAPQTMSGCPLRGVLGLDPLRYPFKPIPPVGQPVSRWGMQQLFLRSADSWTATYPLREASFAVVRESVRELGFTTLEEVSAE